MDSKYALWLVPSGPEAEALRHLMRFRPRPDNPRNEKSKYEKPKHDKPKHDKPKSDKPKDAIPKDDKSKGGKSEDGKSKDGKSGGGKSKDGGSKDGKSQDGKSKDDKSKGAKSSTHSTSTRSTSTRSASSRSISSYSILSYPRSSYPRASHGRTFRSRSYPRFDPHITLATFLCPHRPNIFQLVPMGAKTTPVHFESLEVGDEYLSSLSIIPKKSTELMQLRDRVMDHLKANSIRAMSSSFPHMSLFYLDESFKGERLLLSKQLRETGRVHEQRGGETNFTLNCTVDGAGPEFDAMKGFEGTEIWLVDCTEGVEDWTVLDRRDLKPRMPKPKVYVSRGDPYFNIFGNEGPDPYQVREMASYIPRWGEPGHPGIYGPMAPYYPLDPRYYTHNYAQWDDPRIRSSMYPSSNWWDLHSNRWDSHSNRWDYLPNMNAYRELDGYGYF